MNHTILWKEIDSPNDWDTLIAKFNGHPLQSSKWGVAKNFTEFTKDNYLAAYHNDQLIFLIRFEEKRILKFLKVAWAPRGPIFIDSSMKDQVQQEFQNRLKRCGYFIYIFWQYMEIHPEHEKSPDYTIWLDLRIGKERLWMNLSKKLRYDVRYAKKNGVIISETTNEDDILTFYRLCQNASHHKGFSLKASAKQMFVLLKKNHDQNNVEFRLFVACYANKICGGALISRSGKHIHYLWGSFDRDLSKLCIGEALQWEVIEWGLNNHCELYDLEGIDPKNNYGTYKFKKKLGGRVVAMPGRKHYFLNKYFQIIFNLINSSTIFKIHTKPNFE